MELGAATSSSQDRNILPPDNDRVAEQRLEDLLRHNEESARDKVLYRTEAERRTASLMTRPVSSQKVYSYFGLMIGSLPPLAVVAKAASLGPSSNDLLVMMLLTAAGVVTGLVGYGSGRHIPAMIQSVSSLRAPNNVFAISLVGFVWGVVSGGIGGVFVFLVGAVFAGLIGGVIGAVTLPVLATLHSWLRSGDVMEMKHFLPIALGLTLPLCAFILGL